MSTQLTWAVIVGGLFVIAAVWIAITRRPSRPFVLWRRPMDGQIAHAFYRYELGLDLPDVEALAFCDRWPVAALVVDDDAPRCAACERAAKRMEHHQE